MSATYRDRQDSNKYGSRLIIYRRQDTSEDGFFTFRAKIAGTKGYIRRSVKTSNPARAMLIAEQEYEKLQVRHLGGYSLKELSVDKFFDAWIKTQKTRLTPSRFKWKTSVYERYIQGYMGKRNVSNLTKPEVDGYWDYRLNFWKTPEGKSRILLNAKRSNAKTKSSHNVALNPSFATLRGRSLAHQRNIAGGG